MDDTSDEQTFDRLLAALGRFSMEMLVTYVQHKKELPAEVQAKFDTCVKDWNAVSSELVLLEGMKQGAVLDVEG